MSMWERFWNLAGRVPLRQKIIGIVVTSLLILGFAIAWWVRSGLGGWLSYLLSEERVAQAMNVGTRGVIIITILATLIGLVVAYLLTWILTRPILSITRIAQQVEQGNLELRAPVWARDEIGQLGLAFNAMVDSLAGSQAALRASNEALRNRNTELAHLFELARMAGESVAATGILGYALDCVLETVGAPAGAVTVIDANQRQLVVHATENVADILEDNDDALRFLYQQAWQVRPAPAPQSLPAAALPDAFAGGPCQTCVSVPIRTKDQLAGVLAVFSESDAALSERDEQFLLAVSNQLGVALENARLWEELRRKEAMRTRLLARIVTAQEEERKRISRELHDETGQALTSMLVQLKVMEKLPDLASVQAHAGELRTITWQTLEEVRRLALDLRPAALDDLGLVSALEGYAQQYAHKTGIDVVFTAPEGAVRLPHEYEIVFYRVAQEALSNVVKHAEATQVVVTLERTDDVLRLVVSDNGRGFDPGAVMADDEHGLGLMGMAERMELIGGTLRVETQPGSGTRIAAETALHNAIQEVSA